MPNQFADWLDNRTGYRALVHEALEEPIPGGARWRYVFGSALSTTFVIQLVTGLLLMLSYSPSSSTAWGSVFYTFALLLAPVERELGLTRAQSSLAFSLALLAEGVCAYPVGRWIDRGHERAVMTAGSLLVAIGLAAHAFIHSLAAFYLVWLVLGAAVGGTLYTPLFAVVTLPVDRSAA